MAAQGTLERQVLSEYYELIQILINDAASLSHRLELAHRIEDGEATKCDRRMLRRKYCSNLNDLDREIKHRGEKYIADLEKVLIREQELGIEIDVEDLAEYGADLFGLLADPTRRGKYRSLAKCYKNHGLIVSLGVLELDFQRLPKPA